MAKAAYHGFSSQKVGQDLRVVPKPTVEVIDQNGNNPDLFADRDGTVGKTNPFTGNGDGTFDFYVEAGRYTLKVTDEDGNTDTQEDVLIGKAEVGTLPGLDNPSDGDTPYYNGSTDEWEPRAEPRANDTTVVGDEPWNLANVTDNSKTLGVGDQISDAVYSISFNDDGTQAIISVSDTTVNLLSYDFSTPWDVSTGTFKASATLSGTIRSVQLSPDNSKIFAITTGGEVRQFSLSTPGDITTFFLEKSKDFGNDYHALFISDDGLHLYLIAPVGTATGSIRHDLLSAPWDIGSTSHQHTDRITDQLDAVLNPSGTRLFTLDGSEVSQYALNTAWDVGDSSGRTLEETWSLPAGLSINFSDRFSIANAGQNLYIGDATTIHQYSLGGATEYTADSGFPLADKRLYGFHFDVANTGAATLNDSSQGAKSIKLPDGSDVPANALKGPVLLRYDSGDDVYHVLNAFIPTVQRDHVLNMNQDVDSEADVNFKSVQADTVKTQGSEVFHPANKPQASQVPVADSGGHYSGTDAEAVLQEIATNWIAADGSVSMSADLDFGSNKATNLANATADSDGVTKAQLDAVAQGRSYKDPVRVATAGGNIDLTSATDPNPIDGVTLANGDRVLLKDQTDASENGIYDAVTAADPTTWTRSADADADSEVTAGMAVISSEGTANAEIMWLLTTDDPTLGTDALSFTGFNLAALVAGTGLNKSNNTVSADFASTAEHESGSSSSKVAHPAGVHAAFQQYGLGADEASLPPSNDLNNATTNGWFETDDSTANLPIGASDEFGTVFVSARSQGIRIAQYFMPIISSTTEPEIWVRVLGSSWSDWQRLLLSTDLAQNGGKLLESDQNEDISGEYTFESTTSFNDPASSIGLQIINVGSDGRTIFRVRNFDAGSNVNDSLIIEEDGSIRTSGVSAQGPNSSNWQELYEAGNRIATSDYVFDADQDGEIDTAYYDSVIGTHEIESDTETEEVEEEVEVTETVEEPVDEWCPEKGCYERKLVPRERPVYDEYPVLDADGNQVGTKRVPRSERQMVQRPKRVEVQLQHKPAHRFEHDDLDPATFAQKCHTRRKLPAMDRCEQNLREGQEKPSLGEWTQALMETCEVYAVHIQRLEARIRTLEGK